MRTTITLEDDVSAALKRIGKSRKLRFKDLINLLLREGIKSVSAGRSPRNPFVTQAVDLGTPRFADIDNVAEVLAIAENDSYR